MMLGAEVWRGRFVDYYNVKIADQAHFIAADGQALSDITMRGYKDQYRRVMIDYRLELGADGIDAICKVLGTGFAETVQNIHSRLQYIYRAAY
jgi:hypothetical protein